MHRIVWLIVVTVIANLILEFSGVVAQTSDSNNAILPLPAAQTQLGGQTNAGDVTRNTINNEVENVRPTESTTRTIRPTRPQRSQLFDNIFKVSYLIVVFNFILN